MQKLPHVQPHKGAKEIFTGIVEVQQLKPISENSKIIYEQC
jgi:hypothetical protein